VVAVRNRSDVSDKVFLGMRSNSIDAKFGIVKKKSGELPGQSAQKPFEFVFCSERYWVGFSRPFLTNVRMDSIRTEESVLNIAKQHKRLENENASRDCKVTIFHGFIP
jgi:hypothetical protein